MTQVHFKLRELLFPLGQSLLEGSNPGSIGNLLLCGIQLDAVFILVLRELCLFYLEQVLGIFQRLDSFVHGRQHYTTCECLAQLC